MDANKKHIFDEYIIQGEPSRRQRAENWQIAIGLQDVDRLQNSSYLLDTAKQHIEGTLDLAAAQKRIAEYYQTEEGRKLTAARTDEADIVPTGEGAQWIAYGAAITMVPILVGGLIGRYVFHINYYTTVSYTHLFVRAVREECQMCLEGAICLQGRGRPLKVAFSSSTSGLY